MDYGEIGRKAVPRAIIELEYPQRTSTNTIHRIISQTAIALYKYPLIRESYY